MGSCPQPGSIESPRSSESHGGVSLVDFFTFISTHDFFLEESETKKKKETEKEREGQYEEAIEKELEERKWSREMHGFLSSTVKY